MTKSEAGKIGAVKATIANKAKAKKRKEEYDKNPKLCFGCGNPLPYRKHNYKFCNKSCSAKFNNKKIGRRSSGTKTLPCKVCGVLVEVKKNACHTICETHRREKINKNNTRIRKTISGNNKCLQCGKIIADDKKYCSGNCASIFRKFESWNKIDQIGAITGHTNITVKEYLKSRRNGHKCEICGISEWNGVPVPLVLDHIDGDSDNELINNLRLVCRNCDGLLPTFAGKNMGKGRKTKRMEYRRQYFKDYSV